MSTKSTPPDVTIWYEAEMHGEKPRITPVRVIHETEHTITLADVHRNNARRHKSGTYFPTWESAHEHMLIYFRSEYRRHESAFRTAGAMMEAVQSLQKNKQGDQS